MIGLTLVLVAALLIAGSGLPVLLSRASRRELQSAVLAVAGAALGMVGVVAGVLAGAPPTLEWRWAIPGGTLALAMDGLSAWFLMPVFLISGLGSIYGLGYWRPERGAAGARLRLFYGLLAAGMVLLLVARNSVLFLLGWEVMAVSAFFLVATEHQQPASRHAAWVYLVATHVGTACLIAMFVLLAGSTGSLDWDPAAIASLSRGRSLVVALLALAGFGLKAGVMPLHVWLPAAHANAPSHVSALLSGVMIKMGVYGMVRVSGMLAPLPPWCGGLLLGLGCVTALLGIAAALGQADLKRLLAYSSVENIGIVTMGIGLALLGRGLGEPSWVVLGLGGALLHVANHSLFKPLLFLSAGSVIHATGTRRLDALGGLARPMPRSALGFLAGACAISGLPLLNGFVGELLLYVGFFRAAVTPQVPGSLLIGAGAVVLAMVGGLAVAVFVGAFGAVFLGVGRSDRARHAHESPRTMTGVMAVLVALCAAIGLLPWLVMPLLDGVLSEAWGRVQPVPSLQEFVPMRIVGVANIATTLLGIVLFLGLRHRRFVPPSPVVGTWDCGFVDATSPRLQYTAGSFAQMLNRILAWALARRRSTAPPPSELFPKRRNVHEEVREVLLQGVLLPFFRRWADRCSRLRILQQGNIQVYLLYILVVLLALLSWSVIEGWMRR